MKPEVEERMSRIQRIPWIPGDLLDTDNFFLPLQLNREEKLPYGITEIDAITHYNALFEPQPDYDNTDSKRRKLQRKSILLKGGPGIGKSTIASRMAYEWAVSTWKMFSLVFFISMKVVNPGDPIENIIVNGNVTPSLYDAEYSPAEIKKILKEHGEKILLVFEGFDEMTTNKHILDIIKGQKFRSCNFLVTCRPHLTSDIEQYFTTVGNIEGFDKENAEKLVVKLLHNKPEKVIDVMKFTKENQSIGIHEMWRYPILIIFICILVDDGNFDLTDRKVTLADIYEKLHECLYRRYATKRQVQYNDQIRQQTLLKLGKLAHEGLCKKGRKLLFSAQEIKDKVGEDAFHLGIIIGYKSRDIVERVDADFKVCFLHASIQDYLAALYINHEMQQGRLVEELWPGYWKYDTISKLPLLFTFIIDMCLKNSHCDSYFKLRESTKSYLTSQPLS